MEALRINFEISVNDATLRALTDFAQTITAALVIAHNPATMKAAAEAVQAGAADAKKDFAEAVKQTQQEMTQPEHEVETAADLPVTNQELFDAVKKAKDRGVSPQTIKALFGKYGIASSRECPEDERASLLLEIDNL